MRHFDDFKAATDDALKLIRTLDWSLLCETEKDTDTYCLAVSKLDGAAGFLTRTLDDAEAELGQ